MVDDLLSKVLVPMDGSSTCEAVLSQLRRILRRHESRLVLFHATSFVPWPGDQEPQNYLRRLSFQLSNDGYPCTPLLRRGAAPETILEAAREERVSLIAMTTHGRTGASRLILGSVAERILQVSPVPVLVARSFPSTRSRGKLESRPIRNFLVPMDGSRLSLDALTPVLKLAGPVDAHVTLLHVTEPSPYDGRWESADETLKEADQTLREACIPARIEHRKGNPDEEILKAADELEADLISMSTHGRSGPSRWVFGSVTTNVLRASTVPLLVVRRPVYPEKTYLPAEKPAPPLPALHEPAPGTGLAQPRP